MKLDPRMFDSAAADGDWAGRPSDTPEATDTGHISEPADTAEASAAQAGAGAGLWRGDTGLLHELSRRALLRLLQGPYLSGAANPQLWAALVADERVIRSRLHDLYLELVIDHVDEFAFTRKVRTTEVDVPQALRSERLSFADTVMLLVLRQLLLSAAGERRVIVGQEEVFERLAVYRDGDEVTYQRGLNAAWNRMKNRFRVLHDVGDERVEISPIVKFLVDEDQVRALTEVFSRLAESDDSGGVATGTEHDPDSPEVTETDSTGAVGNRPEATDAEEDQ